MARFRVASFYCELCAYLHTAGEASFEVNEFICAEVGAGGDCQHRVLSRYLTPRFKEYFPGATAIYVTFAGEQTQVSVYHGLSNSDYVMWVCTPTSDDSRFIFYADEAMADPVVDVITIPLMKDS